MLTLKKKRISWCSQIGEFPNDSNEDGHILMLNALNTINHPNIVQCEPINMKQMTGTFDQK